VISLTQTLNHENRFMISMISYIKLLARDYDLTSSEFSVLCSTSHLDVVSIST